MANRTKAHPKGVSSRNDTAPSWQEGYERKLDAMTLPEVWAIVMRAWTRRREVPADWRLIVNNVYLVGKSNGSRAPIGPNLRETLPGYLLREILKNAEME